MSREDHSALREVIADSVRRDDRNALPTFLWTAEQISVFANTHHLDETLVHLVKTLAAGDATLWQQLAEQLKPEADTRAIAVEVIDRFWSDPIAGAVRRINDAGLRAAGDAVFMLHRRALAGDATDRSEWRRVRTALSAATSGDTTEQAAAGVAAAAAWDLGTVPGAASDVIQAFIAMLYAEIDRDLRWDAAKEAAAGTRRERMHAHANDVATAADKATADAERSDASEQEPSETFREAYARAVAGFIAADPSEVDRRDERRQAAYAEAYRLGHEGLLQASTSMTARLMADAS